MSSNPPTNDSNQSRLYTRFITILKIIQILGYFLGGLCSFILLSSIPIGSLSIGFIVFVVIAGAIGTLISGIIVYIITQPLIAIIDLLSRIERNTRSQE